MYKRQIWQSQNFLIRPKYVVKLINRTNLSRNDLVIEIGPGKGIITQILAMKVANVIAIESDKKLATGLEKKFQNILNIKIVMADFLKWKLPKQDYKVFSNIPFNTTADIVNKLTQDKNPPISAYLIMQDKAAFRFIGKPKDNQISILLKPFFDIEVLTKIDRREFSPTPNVDAVLIEIRKKTNPRVSPQSAQWFRDFVVFGFNQWQPTILDSFKNVFSTKQRIILAKKVKVRNKKPSELNLMQWLKLFDAFTNYVSEKNKQKVKSAQKRLKIQQKRLTKLHRTR